MKSFLCLVALVAVASAEADADAQYFGYNGLYNRAYTPYAYAPSVYSGYNAWNGVRYLGKREAEAEADAQYYVNPYNAVSAYSGLRTYGYNYAPSVYSAYAPSMYSGINTVRYLGKREAEAEPEADAQYYVNPYNAVSAYRPYAYNYAPSVYSAYTPSVYSGYNSVRYLGKREAEAEPEADAQYYVNPYTAYSGLRTYGYNYAPSVYSAYTPSVYSGINTVRYLGKREAEADAQLLYRPSVYSAIRPYNTYGYNGIYRPYGLYY